MVETITTYTVTGREECACHHALNAHLRDEGPCVSDLGSCRCTAFAPLASNWKSHPDEIQALTARRDLEWTRDELDSLLTIMTTDQYSNWFTSENVAEAIRHILRGRPQPYVPELTGRRSA